MILVAFWALAEATVFFIVADVPISAIGLRCGTRAAIKAAAIAALAAACGGLIVQYWAAASPDQYRTVLTQIPGIGTRLIESASADFAREGTWAMLEGSLSGTPYKIYAYAAANTPALAFFAASIAARLPRFLAVAWLSSSLGPVLRRRFSQVQVAALFLLFWSLFYTAYFRIMAAFG